MRRSIRFFCWPAWRESELVLVDAKGASGKRGVGTGADVTLTLYLGTSCDTVLN